MNRVRKAYSTGHTTSDMERDRYTIQVGYAIIASDRIFGTHSRGEQGEMTAAPRDLT